MFTNKEKLKAAFIDKVQTMHGKCLDEATAQDKYAALAALLRDEISKKWLESNRRYEAKGVKQVYYFSIEFLLGRLLGTNLFNLGQQTSWQEALAELGLDLKELENQEPDAGLGNGGLGRLAACFLDSMAAMSLPGHGCGIRYKYGLFEQKIIDGYQVEHPDNWLKHGNMWEFRKADKAVEVRFWGNVTSRIEQGCQVFHHENYRAVEAVPYDIPICGYQNDTVNTLRLWSAEVGRTDANLSSFNQGDYLKAIEYRYAVEAISEILYPDDTHYEGRVLRLKQQYFMVSAGLQSIVLRFKKKYGTIAEFADKVTIHINDTHPALAIPELMRILVDEERLGWDEAWRVTTRTIAYTNHTILPEALEKWPVDIFQGLLPRIYMIVHEINERFCRDLWQLYPGEWEKIRAMAIIADGYVHMAHLAVVGSFSVNGVAQIHTEILKKTVMHDLYRVFPYKFNNKTNGITHRRWLLKANPALADLISRTIGRSWVTHPGNLAMLKQFRDSNDLLEQLVMIKEQNKKALAQFIQAKYAITIDEYSIFDVHIKRIHAYKRQLLNVLRIMDAYNKLKAEPYLDVPPRTFVFAGKAAPGYYLAKKIIKLINTLAGVINNDPLVKDRLKVVFIENYSVSLAELIIPATDVSEQISTASKEASGTGNMKFMMNGALTVGTLDGANVEIGEAVGSDNIIIFGLTAAEVLNYYQHGGYSSWDIYNNDRRIKCVLDQLVDGSLPVGQNEFAAIRETLLSGNDEFFVLKDFDSYLAAQTKVDKLYRNRRQWAQVCLENIAHSGWFSSDRTIGEYADGIWQLHD